MNEKPKEYWLTQIYSALSGNLNEEERSELHDWRVQSAEHASFYNEVELFWEMMEFGSAPDHQSIEMAYQDFLGKQVEKAHTPIFRRFLPYISAAAAFIVVFFVGINIFSGKDTLSAGATLITVDKGSHSKMMLPDGTEVWLNSDTKVEFAKDFGLLDRRIKIKGEAFFRVAHDNKKPFIVETGALNVRVHGTSFNLSCYPEEQVRVALVEGVVELVSEGGKSIFLRPNDIVDYNVEQATFLLTKESAAEELIWRESKFVFKDKKFELIILELERAFDVDINVLNKRILAKRFTGDFVHKEDISAILDVMAQVGEFTYEIQNRRIQIK